jgi:predicted nucleotide-binding protein
VADGAVVRRAIASKLGVQPRQVNRLVEAKMKSEYLDRDLASLAVAVEKKVSIAKFARDEDWAALRAAQSHRPATAPASVAQSSLATAGAPKATATRAAAPRPRAKRGRTVMVVYGRDGATKNAMFDFLESLDLKPMSWTHGISQTRIANPTVRQIVDALFAKAVAVVVLLTPDDEARLKSEFHKGNEPAHEKQLSGQARPNVLFEAGMAMSSHPEQTVMTQIGDVKPFTDIGGIHITHLNNSIETRRELVTKLINANCQVDMDNDKWRDAGNFELEETNEDG